ncbi:hypothetical protein RRSWK_04325 [Rhodopirellula sp. SWK7]|nr:hypothetical protein RRSWK_04325 [Rhodopirellula sp. SWK7]
MTGSGSDESMNQGRIEFAAVANRSGRPGFRKSLLPNRCVIST